MKTTIEIKSISQKESREGKPYWEVETDKGRMTAHDQKLMKELSVIWGSNKLAVIEMAESSDGQWKNIRKIYETVELINKGTPAEALVSEKVDELTKEIAEVRGEQPKARHEVPRKGQISMFISYAKDLAAAGKIDVRNIRHWVQEFVNIYNEC